MNRPPLTEAPPDADVVTWLRSVLDALALESTERKVLADRLRRQAEEVAQLHGDPVSPEDQMRPADRLWWTAFDAAAAIDANADRALRRVEADRKILDEYERISHPDRLRTGEYWRGSRDALEAVVRLLASAYAGRDGWREKWAL